MRSGLQNPGAIPLLAVLIAALLSITPILCESLAKAEDASEINASEDPNICHRDSVLATCERVKPVSPSVYSKLGFSSNPSINSTFSNIHPTWQQVWQLTAAGIQSSTTSSKQQYIRQYKSCRPDHRRHHDDDVLENMLGPTAQNLLVQASTIYINNDNTNRLNNSIESAGPIADLTSSPSPSPITISSFTRFSNEPSHKMKTLSFSPPPTFPTQQPSTSKLEKSVVNASSPVDRKGSYMAILVSLVVAIMWF